MSEGQAPNEDGTVAGRRATAFITLERATTDTGWRLVAFSLGPEL